MTITVKIEALNELRDNETGKPVKRAYVEVIQQNEFGKDVCVTSIALIPGQAQNVTVWDNQWLNIVEDDVE